MELVKRALENIDLSRFYGYIQKLNLSSRNSEDFKSFSINDNDFLVIAPIVNALDSSGKPLEDNNNPSNELKIEFSNENGHNFFENPVTYQAFNKLYKNERYLGMYLTDSGRYRVKVSTTGHPNNDINKYPIISIFQLLGYSLANGGDHKYSIKNVMNRIRIERPYTIDKSFTLSSSNSFKTEKITIGHDEIFVTDMNVSLIDSKGRDITLSDKITDLFNLKLKGSDDWVMFEDLTVKAFNSLWQAKNWKGIVLKERTDYWFTIKTENIPNGIYTLNFDAKTDNYTIGDTITGGISGATGVIAGIVENGAVGTLILTDITGTFQNNETIAGAITGSATSDGIATAGACLYDIKAQLSLQGYKLK